MRCTSVLINARDSLVLRTVSFLVVRELPRKMVLTVLSAPSEEIPVEIALLFPGHPDPSNHIETKLQYYSPIA